MEVYAAQIDRMDQGIGRIVGALRDTGVWDNTMIIFLADNGGCAEELGPEARPWVANGHEQVGTLQTRDGRDVRFGNVPEIIPGDEDTYSSYGVPWANVSNTPFRFYKHWVHEGGIATPFIVHCPSLLKAHGELRHQAAQLPDVMATLLEIAGVDYPKTYQGKTIKPPEGFSLVPTFTNLPHRREVLFWEHEGNKAVRKGPWKLVCKHPKTWELYNVETDRTELSDVAPEHPDIVRDLSTLYTEWAIRCEVAPWQKLQEHRSRKQHAAHTSEKNETDHH